MNHDQNRQQPTISDVIKQSRQVFLNINQTINQSVLEARRTYIASQELIKQKSQEISKQNRQTWLNIKQSLDQSVLEARSEILQTYIKSQELIKQNINQTVAEAQQVFSRARQAFIQMTDEMKPIWNQFKIELGQAISQALAYYESPEFQECRANHQKLLKVYRAFKTGKLPVIDEFIETELNLDVKSICVRLYIYSHIKIDQDTMLDQMRISLFECLHQNDELKTSWIITKPTVAKIKNHVLRGSQELAKENDAILDPINGYKSNKYRESNKGKFELNSLVFADLSDYEEKGLLLNHYQNTWLSDQIKNEETNSLKQVVAKELDKLATQKTTAAVAQTIVGTEILKGRYEIPTQIITNYPTQVKWSHWETFQRKVKRKHKALNKSISH